jgi:hypothetical protein
MTPRIKAALVTASVGICLYFLHRGMARRPISIDVGNVSSEWLAHQRAATDGLSL